ncbi:MAG: replication initiator protein A [Myxococcota bacterium]|nr:replication initiator protein A [Myxococcota bacterium]
MPLPIEKRENVILLNKNRQLEKDEADPQLELIQELAFDEMNLVETPFCLLQNSSKDVSVIPISHGGKEYLKIDPNSKFGFPTSLAEPTILGLMWYCQDKNGFKSETCEVKIRELVEDYMYPGKYANHHASGQLLKAVEKELWRVAFTKIYSNRWWDKEWNEHREVAFNIIDINAPAEREKRKARVVRITWGRELFKSVRDRYTKNLNAKLYLQIESPLDRRFFRWLDRHLSAKNFIEVKSIQRFGKYKLLMQGKIIEKGRRTASNYILDKLKASLMRLNGIGFPVRMTADKTKPDYTLLFERITAETNEVVEKNPSLQLVAEFQHQFHGIPIDKRRRLREADIEFASKWIKAYSIDQAVWMVKKSKELHAQSPRSDQKMYYFKGLEAYEVAAASAWETYQKEKAGQRRLIIEKDREKQWDIYEARMLSRLEETLTADEEKSILLDAEERARVNLPKTVPANARDTYIGPLVRIEFKQLKLERAGMIDLERFNQYATQKELEKALIKKHGFNPLKQ